MSFTDLKTNVHCLGDAWAAVLHVPDIQLTETKRDFDL